MHRIDSNRNLIQWPKGYDNNITLENNQLALRQVEDKFFVLPAVYIGDTPQPLKRCINMLWSEKMVTVVLIKDTWLNDPQPNNIMIIPLNLANHQNAYFLKALTRMTASVIRKKQQNAHNIQ
jgi:hypothetical protein